MVRATTTTSDAKIQPATQILLIIQYLSLLLLLHPLISLLQTPAISRLFKINLSPILLPPHSLLDQPNLSLILPPDFPLARPPLSLPPHALPIAPQPSQFPLKLQLPLATQLLLLLVLMEASQEPQALHLLFKLHQIPLHLRFLVV